MTTTETEIQRPGDVAAAFKPLSSDQSFWTIAWRQFKKDRVSMTGLVICGLLAGLAILSPFLANGRPFKITGVLTNFYTSDVAAFNDWHHLYRQRADELADSDKLSPAERTEKESDVERYRRGLPRILDRLGRTMKTEDAAALRDVARRYEALLAVPLEKLDREEHENLGREIAERFGGLAFGPAYKQVSGPLVVFAYGAEGKPALLKIAKDAAEDARNAREDSDAKALDAATKRLAALAPELDRLAKQVEVGGRSMAAFLEASDQKELEQTTAALAETLRGFAAPAADDKLEVRFNELSAKVDSFAVKPIPPERQRLPRTTQHPVIDYLSANEVGFLVVYATLLLALVFSKTFLRLTAKLPIDPSDLGAARIAAIVLPGVLIACAWFVLVPDREPPSDSYYKSFVDDLETHPDPSSAITFAPVPFGENENVQQDKQSPPTWLEDLGHEVDRLRKSPDERPPGVSAAELETWLTPPEKDGKTTPREQLPRAETIGPWARSLVAKRLTAYRYHWLGTDKGGRDILARLIMGSRISLSIGFVSVGLNLLIGVVLGALAGYFRGWIDVFVSRFTEILMCIPTFFLILTVRQEMPSWVPAIWAITITLGLISWTGEMRLVRGEFLRLVDLDFVTAGRALGLSDRRVIFRHMLPNAMAPVLVSATFGIAGAILTESALSFLGFGVQPPEASWGSVLNEAFGAEKEMWWVTVFPGFMIFLTITAYNLVGEGFRDATDPRLRK
jgi:peptide/nickel transport system permease protein